MSLAFRFALAYLLITLVGVLLLGGVLLTLVENTLTTRRDQELAAQVDLAAALLAELAGSTAELPNGLAAVAGALPNGAAVRIFSNEGLLLNNTTELGPFPSRAALALIRSPVPLPASQVAERRYSAHRIPGPTGSLGVVEISRDSADNTQLLRDLRRLVLQAAIGSALVMALLSVVISQAIARPVQRLTRRADVLAQSVAVDRQPVGSETRPDSRDEVRRLQVSLDRLEAALNNRLERIGTLEQARTQFYRSVSHELRTPLTVIRAGLENLADEGAPDQRAALTRLEAEAARLGRLVDELLQPPADGALPLATLQRIDLAELVPELSALLAGRARRAGVTLTWNAPVSVLVQADRDRLKQAVLNLLDNAFRVTAPGGAIELALQRVDGWAQISVTDSGPGVAAAEQAMIWERGYSGTAAGSAGLGLALVRAIAQAHSGTADLDPQHTPGARFWIRVPAIG